MKRNDIILIAIILILGIGLFGFMYMNKKEGGKVEISIKGEVVKELPLNEDTTYTIEDTDGHKNVLVIKDGYATIKSASCPDQVCVYQKDIHYNGESLICLPNQVMIRVIDGEKQEMDSVVN